MFYFFFLTFTISLTYKHPQARTVLNKPQKEFPSWIPAVSSSPLLLPEFLEEQPILSFFNSSLPLTLQTTTVWFLSTLAEELTFNNCWKVKFRRVSSLADLCCPFGSCPSPPWRLFPPWILGCSPFLVLTVLCSAAVFFTAWAVTFCGKSDQMPVGVYLNYVFHPSDCLSLFPDHAIFIAVSYNPSWSRRTKIFSLFGWRLAWLLLALQIFIMYFRKLLFFFL